MIQLFSKNPAAIQRGFFYGSFLSKMDITSIKKPAPWRRSDLQPQHPNAAALLGTVRYVPLGAALRFAAMVDGKGSDGKPPIKVLIAGVEA